MLLLAVAMPARADPVAFDLADAAWNLGDHQRAARLWLELAEQGHDLAQLYVGYLHKIGRGLPRSAEQAARWYRAAAEQGNPNAQYQLGLMYELGHGVQTDGSEAEYWYGLAVGQDFCPGELPAGGYLGDE